MSEENQNDVDMGRGSDPEMDQSLSRSSTVTNLTWLRRQSMPLLLPSIFEQQCLRKRTSLTDERCLPELRETEIEIDHVGEKTHTSKQEGGSEFTQPRRSVSVDFGKIGGGKHTLERGNQRSNKTLMFKKRLEEMEKGFSQSTLNEIRKLKHPGSSGQSDGNLNLSHDEM